MKTKLVDCYFCRGTGLRDRDVKPKGQTSVDQELCPDCKATGKVEVQAGDDYSVWDAIFTDAKARKLTKANLKKEFEARLKSWAV